jgi:hypothetical protein
MKNYGRTSLNEFLGERVVYRNLEPADPGLPGLKELMDVVDIAPGKIPRKSEADYARVIVKLLEQAQVLRGVRRAIKRLLFVGDTQLLDGTAFYNICLAGEWPGLVFIGSENAKPASIEVLPNDAGQRLYLANRWTALVDFAGYAASCGFPTDESTVVILDIDKTALGARGRNGQVIDKARVQALQDTVAGLLGAAFDLQAFHTAYDLLNQPEFHPFTADNQDYLAYICLILGSGLYRLEEIVADIRGKRLVAFEGFLAQVDAQARELPPRLAELHADIYANVKKGDPTPFKSFRRNEYLTTIRCFGQLEDSAPVEALLAQEILVTQEVREVAHHWQKQGALMLGLSDKPDEAATPSAELARQGYLPIHQAVTHSAGE